MQRVDGSANLTHSRVRGRDDDGSGVEQTEYAAIQELVMKRAERQSVIEIVRSLEVEPANMGRFDADGCATKRTVVTAKCTRSIPRSKDPATPVSVPLPQHDRGCRCRGGRENEIWVQPNGGQDVGGDRQRELTLHNCPCNRVHCGRRAKKLTFDLRREMTFNWLSVERADIVVGHISR